MIRFAALFVAVSVIGLSVPAAADVVPIKKQPAATKKIKQKRIVRKKHVIEKEVVVEKKAAPPPIVAPPPVAAPPPLPAPLYVWIPGHWTWNGPMNTHVWVPGMYILPPSPQEEQRLAQWRIGKWIGIGRDD